MRSGQSCKLNFKFCNFNYFLSLNGMIAGFVGKENAFSALASNTSERKCATIRLTLALIGQSDRKPIPAGVFIHLKVSETNQFRRGFLLLSLLHQILDYVRSLQ